MKIAVDARTFKSNNNGRGVVRVLSNLLRNWLSSDCSNEYYLYSDDDIVLPEDLQDSDKINIRIVRSHFVRSSFFWENFILPKQLYEDKVSVLFSPAYTTSVTAKIPKVLLVHDISYKAIKTGYYLNRRFILDSISRLSCYASNRIITVSEYSKSEIMKYYGLNSNKIQVIYNGIERKFCIQPNPNEANKDYKEKKRRYILYVGTFFKRRHVEELLEAYCRISRDEPDLDLVLVGENRIFPCVNIDQKINRFNDTASNSRIYWKKFVTEEDLLRLYRECEMFMYLSDYEGFGFPPLEAMACGVPVITGTGTSLSEILGDASTYVNPYDIDEICMAIRKLCVDRSYREEMIARGVRMSKKYSWEQSSVDYNNVFEEILCDSAK